MSLFASRSSHWSSRTSTQRARVKSEGMSTRSRRLRWWEGGSQWEASQGSHARCAGSVRAVVGSGQGGQAHPSCPGSARVPALRTRRNPALVEYIVLVHWVYRIQSTPRFFRKRSGQMANRSRTALIYFSRAHTTEVSPSAGGISFRRKRITNERGGQAHPCDGWMSSYPAKLSKANTWIYRAATSHPRVGHPTRRDNPVLALGHLDPLGCHRGAWMAQHPGRITR